VRFKIIGGLPNTYNVLGNKGVLNNDIFESNPLPDGKAYNFLVTDAGKCSPLEVSGIGSCACDPKVRVKIVPSKSITCNGKNDGAIAAKPSNAPFGYTYLWNNGASDSLVHNLSAGFYTVTLTYGNHCVVTDTFRLTQPKPISALLQAKPAHCHGDENGSIAISKPKGGTPKYEYALEGRDFQADSIFQNLFSNVYKATVRDANGCLWRDEISVGEPSELVVRLGEDFTAALGETIELTPFISNPIDSFFWLPDTLGEIGLNPSLKPRSTMTYTLTVRDKNGCQASDKIVVSIDKKRHVFAPNVFSPNNDGHNDRFMLYGGIDAERILSLTLYNRWGSPVFEATDLPFNDEQNGWDGRFLGKEQDGGLFIFVAEIRYIDGHKEKIGGDVLLMR
jgi:gliding motility-associated-like protein